MSDNIHKKQSGLFYGWLIVFAACLNFFMISLVSSAMGVTLAAVRTYAGLTATQTSMVLTVKTVTSFIVVFGVDFYYKKLNLRMGLALSTVFSALGYLAFAFAGSNVFMYYIGAVLMGTFYGFSMMYPMTILASRWFNKSRGTVLALISTGTGLGGLIATPALQAVVDSMGLTTMMWVQVILNLAVSVLQFLIIRNDPKDKGLEPYGGADHAVEGKKKRGASQSGFQKIPGTTVGKGI